MKAFWRCRREFIRIKRELSIRQSEIIDNEAVGPEDVIWLWRFYAVFERRSGSTESFTRLVRKLLEKQKCSNFITNRN